MECAEQTKKYFKNEAFNGRNFFLLHTRIILLCSNIIDFGGGFAQAKKNHTLEIAYRTLDKTFMRFKKKLFT